MHECNVADIPEFIGAVLELGSRWFPDELRPDIWFRGTENRDLALLPGAYWRKKYDERTFVLDFRSMVPSYLDREPTDEWEWYYLMQHYGVPTRLLDWSESPLVSLYFALAKEPAGGGPCVWVIDPVALNTIAQGFTDGTVIAPVTTDPDTPSKHWLPDRCRRGEMVRTFDSSTGYRDNAKPLAVFPKRYNPRIVAQRGVFTVHGIEEIPIDEIMRNSASVTSEARIARFCFDPASRSRLKRDLYCLGVSKAALFPEPQSVAEDLREQYGSG
jgi:FRG domain